MESKKKKRKMQNASTEDRKNYLPNKKPGPVRTYSH